MTCSADSTALTHLAKLFTGFLVFFMQTGFAMLEAGSLGSTATTSILFKNLLDVLLGGIAWFLCGYAFAYGDGNEFIGTTNFALYNVEKCVYTDWFYTFGFASTAATIVSGCISGRTKLIAYLCVSVMISGWTYPVIVRWTWSDNPWLTGVAGDRYRDFAGSGVVHVCGGAAGLVGAIIVGPRGTRIFESFSDKSEIPGHSIPLTALGTLILFMGFLAFNGGSVATFETTDDASMAGLAIVNSVLAGAGGGLAAVLTNVFIERRKYWSMFQMCNGTIGGIVSICAGADIVYPWAALVIGLVSVCVYKCWSVLIHRQGIDDPVDAASVHMGCGLWGIMAPVFFAREESIFYSGDNSAAWYRLGWALCAGVVIVVWASFWAVCTFSILKYLGLLRVSDDNLERGLDIVQHGESAYVFTAIVRDTNLPMGPLDMKMKGLTNGTTGMADINRGLRARKPLGAVPERVSTDYEAMETRETAI